MVKNPPAMQETQVQSLGWEESLEKGLATHSSILAWRIPWTEELGGLQTVHEVAKTIERLTHFSGSQVWASLASCRQFLPQGWDCERV